MHRLAGMDDEGLQSRPTATSGSTSCKMRPNLRHSTLMRRSLGSAFIGIDKMLIPVHYLLGFDFRNWLLQAGTAAR
jgi:hypothetical protein